jgi:nicotinamide-nucleotide amidase
MKPDTVGMSESLEKIAQQVADGLLEGGLMLATAESCTGGWVAKVLTDIAGSSEWFDRGFVTYSNAAKQEMLGVSEQTLSEQGAVSEAVVKEMVVGALASSGASLALSVSGIAGPGGGSQDKPVGMVWFAWQRTGGSVQTLCQHFSGDRDSVRRQAVIVALRGVLALL